MNGKRWLALVLSLLLVLSLALVPGCASDDEPEAEEPVVEEPVVEEEPAVEYVDASAEILAAGAAYLGSGPAPTIASEDLYNALQAGDTSYQVVSIRGADHYALGHIEGAINIGFKEIYTEENLAKLDPNKKIVVVCYTGHTASMATMFYNLLGYDATALRFGMSGWTTDEVVYAAGALPDGVAKGYETTTEVPETGSFDLPMVDGEYMEARDAIIGEAEKFFAAGIPFTISADDVYNNVVAAADPGYQILSVRMDDVYGAGHLPGAINAVWTSVADEAVLSQLDPSKKTIVYCYTGHTGAQAAMFMNLMGYETINMKFGMSAWNSDPEVGGNGGYDPAAVANYATVAGAE